MSKYLVVFQTRIKNLLEYRVNILLKLVRPLIMTAAFGALWIVLFQLNEGRELGGFTQSSFIIYLLIIRFIAVFSPGASSIGEMNEEISSGNFTMRLVRPVHYLWWLFFRNLPIPLFSGIVGLTAVTLLAWIFDAALPRGPYALLFVLSVVATIGIQYAFYQGIGILSFWIYEISSIERFWKMTSQMLSGEMIPLSLFPVALQSVLYYSPFAALAFVPGGIYIGLFDLEQAVRMVVVQYVWAVSLWTLVLWIYRRGLQKFEAQGG